MAWQVETVSNVARRVAPDIEIKPMLCFVEANWGWFAKPFRVRGVVVCWPRALRDLLDVQGPHDARAVDEIAARLAVLLPSA